MKNLEKLIFFEITNRQQGKVANTEHYNNLEALSDLEKDEFYKLEFEVHNIWNNLNGPKNILSKKYISFEDYQNNIIVSPMIISIMNEFNLTLKEEISEKTKKTIIKLMGKDFYDQNF